MGILMLKIDYQLEKQISNRLNDSVFVDYIWFRTCSIIGLEWSPPAPRSLLEEKLFMATKSVAALSFMQQKHNYNCSNVSLELWLKTLENEFDTTCLTGSEYAWIDVNNNSLLYFLWRILKHVKSKHPIKNTSSSDRHTFEICRDIINDNIVQDVNYNQNLSHKPHKNDIVCLINRLQTSQKEKLDFVKYLIELSGSAMKIKDVKQWIDKNPKDKIPWLNDYLTCNQTGYISLVINGNSDHGYDLISFFDVLSISNNDRYKLLVSNFKKAWNQKTFREKNKMKKQYSISMSKDIGSILDKLSLARNENKNSIVEALIRAEYAKIARP